MTTTTVSWFATANCGEYGDAVLEGNLSSREQAQRAADRYTQETGWPARVWAILDDANPEEFFRC